MQLKFIVASALVIVFLSGCSSSPKKKSPEEIASVYLQLGVRYLALNKLEVAKQNLEKAMNHDSSNAEIHNSLGVLHQKLNQYDDANDYFEEALSLAPNNFSVQNNYGRFLCERGQVTEGLVFLQKVIASPINHRPWQGLSNMGFCQLQANVPEKAEVRFRQALKFKTDYAPALLAMQKISFKKGDYWGAKAFLERYISTGSKQTAETLWLAVQAEHALGHEKTAEEYSRQLFSGFSMSPEAKKLEQQLQ